MKPTLLLIVFSLATYCGAQDSTWWAGTATIDVAIIKPSIKIGELTINGKEAEAYLKWCYEHPDTIDYDRDFEKIAIKKIQTDTIFYGSTKVYSVATRLVIPSKPTDLGFIKWKFER